MRDPESTPTAEPTEASDLVPSLNIENLLRLRASALERIEQAVDLIREANAIAAAGHFGELDVRLWRDTRPTGRFDATDIMQVVQREIDAVGWDYLMNESGIRTFMDATARQTWDAQISTGEIPALTRQNVASTFRQLYEARAEMFERGVIECFQRLSWNYRTNQPFKFGKRIVLQYLFQRPRSKERWLYLNRSVTNELDDLMRVLAMLDGRAEPDHRQGMSSQLLQVRDAGRMQWEGDYFTLRWYWKGTGHLTFKRMDLVEQMNAILARRFPNALASPRP